MDIPPPVKRALWFLGLTIFVKNKMKCSFRLFNISGKRNIRGLESELYRHFIDIEVFNDNVITANAHSCDTCGPAYILLMRKVSILNRIR